MTNAQSETMRERIEKAICCPNGCVTVGDSGLNCVASLTCAEETNAVLAAMREPTLDVLKVGVAENPYEPDEMVSRGLTVCIWQAMIDAATAPRQS